MPHAASARSFTIVVLLAVAVSARAEPPAPELVSLKKIWDAGHHNAFTDLARWHDRFWCTFREADAHVGGDGQIRVLVSNDGESWESAALLSDEGVDLRVLNLCLTPEDTLMLTLSG